jgi:hypothetical protein
MSDVQYTDLNEAAKECDLFLGVTRGLSRSFTESFMTAASPEYRHHC